MLETSSQFRLPKVSEAAINAFNNRTVLAAQQRSPELASNAKFQALMAYPKLAPFFSFVIQSVDDLEIVYLFMQVHSLSCSLYLVPELTEKILQIEELALPAEKQSLTPQLAQEILTLVRQFFLSYAQLNNAKESTGQKFAWEDFAAQSIHALNDLIEFINLPTSQLHLFKIRRIEQINQALNDYLVYAIAHDSIPIRFDLVKPTLEVLLLIDLLSFIPGEYEKLSREFYSQFQDLSAKASETTGDTEQQLALIKQIFNCIVAAGQLTDESVYADTGCGDGLRILKPLLDFLQTKHGIKPLTLAVDLMPPKANCDWVPIKVNFSHPDFIKQVKQALATTRLDNQKVQVMTLSWSPINDLHKTEQLQAFRNFSAVMAKGGYLILDVPAGYEQKVAQAKQVNPQRPYGEITVEFFSEAGKLAKLFTINPIRDYLFFALLAGFQVVNLEKGKPLTEKEEWPEPYYQTQTGKDRAILIFRKVGNGTQSLAENILKIKMV